VLRAGVGSTQECPAIIFILISAIRRSYQQSALTAAIGKSKSYRDLMQTTDHLPWVAGDDMIAVAPQRIALCGSFSLAAPASPRNCESTTLAPGLLTTFRTILSS
jgi:hypothetical protein